VSSHVRRKMKTKRRWLRLLLSGLISFLVFAATYPNVILPGGGIRTSAFVYILCVAFAPFVLICAFACRNSTLESIGWGGHFITLAAAFLR
jgi:hypothetical protein